MTNNKQKSKYWRNLDQQIADHNSIVDDKTLIEQFLIECGKYGDTAQIPDEVIETYIRREKIKMEEIELNAKEIVIIKQCAEESTSAAHDKELHRQQIIAAYKAAMHTQYLKSFTMDQQGHVIHKADDYYNKTYNKK